MTEVAQSDTVPGSIGEEIGLVEIVGFFKRQWLVITACTAIAVVVSVVYHGLFVHPLFKSAATLVVVSPTGTPEPEPGELSLLGYRRFLVSDAVRAQTEHDLQDAQLLEPGEPFRLESHAFFPLREEKTALAPVLELVGYARSPEKAAAVANTWAEVFVDLTRELSAAKNEANLAQTQDFAGTVRIAAAAVPTGQRDLRRAGLSALLAAIAGAALGLVVALFREFGAAAAIGA